MKNNQTVDKTIQETCSRSFSFSFQPPAVQSLCRRLQIPIQAGKTFSLRSKTLLQYKPKWKDREYRQNYMQAALEQTISWQIKINREARGMSQQNLASAAGLSLMTIQENEDTTFEDHDLKALVRMAHAFDCALTVKFIPYSALAHESRHLSENDLYAKPMHDRHWDT